MWASWLKSFRGCDRSSRAVRGSRSAGEGQSLFLVDWNLSNAAQLILNRIFNRDDFVFVGFDLIDGSVQGGGFAAARRSGDQHHSVWLFDVTPKFAQVFLVKAYNVQG